MKKMKKRFLAMGVCLAVLFCSLMPAQPVNAAAKTVNLTVRYKGRNVTFEAYRNMNTSKVNCTQKAKTYAAVKKAWGKANEVEKEELGDYHCWRYAWKSGKTSISFFTDKKGKRMGDIVIDIQNKKATLCGIKVGMSKKQALQKLRKQFDKKNVSATKNQILVKMGPFNPMTFNLKSGKISSIYFWHS